ncbi:3-carboxy-cis,cis-muconate cycloisomerase [Zafaria cholistanensis]|uniref:3-carboxy-cis,cis-muconate cycloisomerase n=1 Tax=Zafaria cholistanensis TaxID=1682741 RepID=A0A5A7NQZ2_9MICC|nr:lyase family protein [Zafaria cholistanensis]GER23165.1 3-carboxy-cis,cis-muconate cycloisomerase [Zafaria cholistanensis]
MTHPDYGILSPAWAGTPVAAATADGPVVQAMLDVEAAWVAVLADAGLAPAEDADAVDEVADAALYDLPSLAARGQDGGNPLIPLLADLRRELKKNGAGASAASTVHRGATSQDIVDTALMVVAARAGALVRADLLRAADALAGLAREHMDTLCVARSLTQHALPTTFGLRAANWLSGVVLAARRLDAALAALPLQWGGAVGTLASLTDFLEPDGGTTADALAASLAERLGLAQPAAPWHTNRLPVTGLGAALADVAAASGKMAADVLLLSRPELGEVSEPQEEGKGGSSAMPQKRNPVLSVLIRNAALAAPQHAAQLFLAAGTAVDERPDGAWHTEWAALRELLRLAGGAAAKLAALAEGLGVHPEAMARNMELTGDLLVSERLASRLAPLVDGGKATVQRLVRESLGTPEAPGVPLRPALRAAVPVQALSDRGLEELLDPAGYLGQHRDFIERILAEHAGWKES